MPWTMVTAPLSSARRALFFAACVAGGFAILLAAPAARPCGAFFPSETDTNTALLGQRALYVLDRERVSLHLQVTPTFEGQADFAWILPIPAAGGVAGDATGLPTLALGDATLFEALDALTRPQLTITREDAPAGGIGCGDAGLKSGNGLRDLGPVSVFDSGTLGPYTYDIIAGTDAAAIATWLEENAYAVPDDLEGALAPYVEGSRFVAIKQTVAGAVGPSLAPLVVTFDRPLGATIAYPFSLSRLSTTVRAPFVIWTLTDRRHRIVNYGSIDLLRVAEEVARQEIPYNAAMQWLTDRADGRLVVTEFARDLTALAGGLDPAIAALVDSEHFYLTRLFGDTPVDAMEDLIITHAPNAPEVEPEVVVDASDVATNVGRTAGGALFLFVLIGLVRRRAASR